MSTPASHSHSRFVRISRWCAHHRWHTFHGWVLLVAATIALGSTVGTAKGRVITAAALIMIVVFTAFALTPERVIKEFGLGLAVAVLLDALVIRCLLVPALMQVVGSRAWWAPAWLERRMPHLAIEPE